MSLYFIDNDPHLQYDISTSFYALPARYKVQRARGPSVFSLLSN